MGLTQLANLGEFIGGVAVLVTLIYLAVQVKQNTMTVRAASIQSLNDSSSSFLAALALDENGPQFFQQLLTEEQVGEIDWIRLNLLLHSMFRRYESVYLQHKLITLDPAFWQGWEATIVGVAAMPGTRSWWADQRRFFSDEFGRFIDSVLEDATPVYGTPGVRGALRANSDDPDRYNTRVAANNESSASPRLSRNDNSLNAVAVCSSRVAPLDLRRNKTGPP